MTGASFAGLEGLDLGGVKRPDHICDAGIQRWVVHRSEFLHRWVASCEIVVG